MISGSESSSSKASSTLAVRDMVSVGFFFGGGSGCYFLEGGLAGLSWIWLAAVQSSCRDDVERLSWVPEHLSSRMP